MAAQQKSILNHQQMTVYSFIHNNLVWGHKIVLMFLKELSVFS